jgi:Ion transport protein
MTETAWVQAGEPPFRVSAGREAESRSSRMAKRFEIPILIAAVLAIPAIALEEASVSESWKAFAAGLNWLIWVAFVVELVVMLAVAPNRRAWLRAHPLELVIVLLTPPVLPASLQAIRALRLLRLLRLLRIAPLARRVFSLEGLRYVSLLALVTALGGGAAFAAVEKHMTTWDGVWWAVTKFGIGPNELVSNFSDIAKRLTIAATNQWPAATDPAEVKRLALAFAHSPELAEIPKQERQEVYVDAFRAYTDRVLEDDFLSVDEQNALTAVMEALQISPDSLNSTFRDIAKRLAIAAANAGRLPTLPSSHLMTRANEIVHWEDGANLMKEVVLREFVGGYSGFSFPIAKGIRYRTGSARGHSVVTGTQLQVADNGYLTVTSQRVAYMGARKSIEIPLSKVMGVDVFTDGIRFHISNRQNAPLFQIEQGAGDAVAAIINAAIRELET